MKPQKKALRKSIDANPHFINTYFFLSEIEAFAKDDPAFAKLEELKMNENLRGNDKGALGFALGRMYHGIKNYEKAFENYKFGNDNSKDHFASIGYAPNHETMAQINQLVTALYSPENRQKLSYKGSSSTKPIFIVGMPRSGTTLLEQIMSSHTNISTAGELREIPLIHKDLMVKTNSLQGPARELAQLSLIEQEGESFAASYLKKLEEEGEATDMIIDKMPQNFLHLGLINVLFPKAKIIHIRRDPMDVGLSIYSNQFSIDWRFFQDLGDIGYYIRKYRALMVEWRGIIDLPVHDIEYQALIDDPEKIARGVIEFCGHEWQPQCLDFYKNRSKVHTASVLQVREPVNRSGLGKWKKYKKYLGPLKAALEE